MTTYYLNDYKPSVFEINKTELDFDIYDDKTIVKAKLQINRNPNSTDTSKELVLDGNSLKLLDIKLDGKFLSKGDYRIEGNNLIVTNMPDSAILETTVQIHPETNTELEGLYKSRVMYTTQCEAQGFRRITYYLDRPDVMSVFTTTIRADKAKYPVLLSNGNLVAEKDLDNGRHMATWEDPTNKPSYLFAVVAGDLEHIKDTFTTKSGRVVDLRVYAEKADIDKCQYSMDSLIESMKWDEEVFGREYDLDMYMIVAVSDFNSGAMENKGLNIFNTEYALANPKIATDDDYKNVERVIGHEYFHNWTGNRITLRDWFHLSIKEGLTVYREQEFAADMSDRAVKRIDDVAIMRTAQFNEDAGPLAHPIRPESYQEIRNFYTVTVYDKGSEVIRMLPTIFGKDGFMKGMDLYFDRFDGKAVTAEDFLGSMEEANNVDLSQFKLWYSQAGTPELKVTTSHDKASGKYTVTIKQETRETPETDCKKPFVIPVKMSLISKSGNAQALNLSQESILKDSQYTHAMQKDAGKNSMVVVLEKEEQSFTFEGVNEDVIPSLLQDFSAPVKVHYEYSNEDLVVLAKYDVDNFNRYDAIQLIYHKVLNDLMMAAHKGEELKVPAIVFEMARGILKDAKGREDISSRMLVIPSINTIIQKDSDVVDLDAIMDARDFLVKEIARELEDEFLAMYKSLYNPSEEYALTNDAIARRNLKACCLSYLNKLEREEYANLAKELYDTSNNVTDTITALAAIKNQETALRDALIEQSYQDFKSEDLLVNKWLSLNAAIADSKALERAQSLVNHEAFDYGNPNKIYSLIRGFAANHKAFHNKDGSGYKFIADNVIKLNSKNAQVASRVAKVLTNFRRFDAARQDLMKEQLRRIKDIPNLSDDVAEVVNKGLDA